MKKKQKASRTIITAVIMFIFLIAYVYAHENDLITESSNTEETYTQEQEVPGDLAFTSDEEKSGNVYLEFLDVGQADSILISICGEYVLIDCGNIADGPLVTEHLKNLGIDKLEYLIITHPHEDHMGGAVDVINGVEIGHIIMPDRMKTTKIFEKMLDAITERNVDVIFPNVKDVFEVNGGTFTVLSCDNDAKDDNGSSVVTLFTYDDFDVLLTGDATTANEKEILTWYEFNDIEVLKLAHHGSVTGNSKKYLEAVSPENAIISVGRNNTYNLPKDEIIERVEKLNIPIYRTDESGTIIVTYDNDDYKIEIDGTSYDGDEK